MNSSLFSSAGQRVIILLILTSAVWPSRLVADPPHELRRWIESPQRWSRDTDGPIVSLGLKGEFDDMHIFAPAAVADESGFRLWYCGSTGAVAERVFHLGLATSKEGRTFQKRADNPVYKFGDGKHSILTPTVLREGGRLRMWFSSTWFKGGKGLHTLHETLSDDGITWSAPSPVLLENVYAPTIIKTGRHYQMWFVDVGSESWIIRHAWSIDGRQWRVTPEPCLVVDQPWEKSQLFYPMVAKVDDAYLMWYGSYWSDRPNTTALGFAVSIDGMKWYKHPNNPVLQPDASRPWESNYVTSQSVIQLPDGSFRIWYASRKKPPFINKYFAINTAIWRRSESETRVEETNVDAVPTADVATFRQWQMKTRSDLREMLGIPSQRVPLSAEKRGEIEWDGVVIEKWVFTTEPGSRVPAVLYRPKVPPEKPMPAIVHTFGHGGSKSQWQYNYAGQVYARLGVACLSLDPLGEEERHIGGRLGTRAHDPKSVSDRADKAGRLVMGKLVLDTMRGIDFLIERNDIDPERIGVAGNSLGGAKAGWMAALEPRIRMAIVSGWAYQNIGLRTKYCTKLPNQRMREQISWAQYASLAAPDCAVLIANGDADWVIDRDDDKSAWRGQRKIVDEASGVYERFGAAGNLRQWYEPGGGHRPYFAYKESLEWIHDHLGTPAMSRAQIRSLPTINAGQWCDAHAIKLETLYGTPLHQRGATLPDLNIRPTPREQLACLKPEELGSTEYTVEGWLKKIEENE